MKLILFNNLDKSEHIFDNLEDTLESRMFYSFIVTIPEGMVDGEYTYQLYDDNNKKIAFGLCQIGNYDSSNKVYNNNTIRENNGYITYGG